MYIKDYIDGVADQKKKSAGGIRFTEVMQGSMQAAALGAIGGMIYGYIRGKSLFWCAFTGALAVGVVSNIFIVKK